MQRIKLFFIVLLFPILSSISCQVYAQARKLSIEDQLLQDSIYKSNKKKVLNFSMKEFQVLFLDYFDKKNDSNLTLTKTQFYTYTVQIAAFSDRLTALYPDKKQVAEENKQHWLSESYEDYLKSKAQQKK